MKIRLHGSEDECRDLAGRLPAICEVLAVSEPYPDRGASRMVRVYVEVRPAYEQPADRPRQRRALPSGGPR